MASLRVKMEPWKGKVRTTQAVKLKLEHPNHKEVVIDIHRRFVTEMDTVPLFKKWLKKYAPISALMHDWMYRNIKDRKNADAYFLMLMAYEKVPARYRLPLYWAARLFGAKIHARKIFTNRTI